MTDDTPTATHADAALTRTAAGVSHAELLLTLTRGADRPPPAGDFRFPPGTVLLDRYRIVAPLGRGGMGEVYRADDLTLGQAVALKFLPEHVSSNPASLERFRKEVAAARQVAHPHVCRVFDIGEADGQVFLSMEFIPGDDLAGVLRKAWRLSSGLAIDLARQVAAGLQAVHDEGLVHRDLKPANVMVDGKGRARLTDFGLAATSASISGTDAFSGTPAYQAPEQLGGRTISERTDVYALGLLAYELLTGRRPFDATDRKGLSEQQRDTKPPAPSSFDPTIPPDVDRIVLKCLAFDPKDRPTSAHEVWRTLPGDAALNAALAAGVTPSAEAVADAGGEGRLKRWVAITLAVVSVGLAAIGCSMMGEVDHLAERMGRPPSELKQACRDTLDLVDRPLPTTHTATGYDLSPFVASADWRDENDYQPDRNTPHAAARLSPVVYFLRTAPQPLQPHPPTTGLVAITSTNPPFGEPGSSLIKVDGRGRLRSLYRVPLTTPDAPGGRPPPWHELFESAGLEMSAFSPAEPSWDWHIPHSARHAWTGSFPERPSIPLRVEAATHDDELVGFVIAAPWSTPADDMRYSPPNWASSVVQFIALVFLPALMLLVGGWLAYRNVRRGTADVRGAIRLAAAYALCRATGHILALVEVGGEWGSLFSILIAQSAFDALRLGLGYLAIEPYARRRWAPQLIGWQRMLSGRWTDPQIGRDMLIGLASGAAVACAVYSYFLFQSATGVPPIPPPIPAAAWHNPLGTVFEDLTRQLDGTLLMCFAVFLLAATLRRVWIWLPVLSCCLGLMLFSGAARSNFDFVGIFLIWVTATVQLLICVRYGLLVTFSTQFGMAMLGFPLVAGWGTWFWPAAAVGWAVILTLTAYGLVVSVGGWRRLVWGEKEG